ncbi:hypothetical protein NMG60_11008841 [Bertholletia excelsa]
MRTRKRKARDQLEVDGSSSFSFDDLNQDLLEELLSWLPTSAFYRLSSVCKRWKSVANSKTFLLACSHVPSRQPWFFMVDPHLTHPIVFDTVERNWKQLNCLPFLLNASTSMISVASSGGLICFRSACREFIVCNPLTSSFRQLPPLTEPENQQPLQAIGMNSSSNSYKLVLAYGDLQNLSVKVYVSSTDCWMEEIMLKRLVDENCLESNSNNDNDDNDADDAVYFLCKSGIVVSTNMERSPSKQYSSVLFTAKRGDEEEETLYFISTVGTIVACNLTRGCFCEYPRILPMLSEYSIDVVQCGEEVLVVVLSEFLESASLRVWKFDEENRLWLQIAAMPPAMSHELYGKRVDINCCGSGHQILVCLNSDEFSYYVVCDVMTNEWTELPACYVNGKGKEFLSAFSFEPRIEAQV